MNKKTKYRHSGELIIVRDSSETIKVIATVSFRRDRIKEILIMYNFTGASIINSLPLFHFNTKDKRFNLSTKMYIIMYSQFKIKLLLTES